MKPERLVDREAEWALLHDFATGQGTDLQIAIVSGRRRNGKSFLLDALVENVGGMYLTAVQEEGPVLALLRFVATIAAYARVPVDSLRLSDWEQALTTALDVVNQAPGAPLLVIDELPYLLEHSPQITGLLQLIYDRSRLGGGPGGRIILCGSALSVMTDLLSGTKPLRGRAVVDLRLPAFDYRTSRNFWQITDAHTALLLDACIGGAPGYRALSPGPAPQTKAEFDDWVTGTLLNPGLALYSRSEAEYLLREDPRILHKALYYDVLSAVARGASTPSQVGALLQRQRSAMMAPLETLESSGYLRRDEDLLRTRKPSVRVADSIIRFNQLITSPQADLVERGRARIAWDTSQPTFHSKILGPHFEEVATEWTRTFAFDEIGARLGTVGQAEVDDHAARTKHQVDVMALAPGERPQTPHAKIALLGEAKATIQPRGVGDLARLEHIRSLLTAGGHPSDDARLALFSLHGFRADLERTASERDDIVLVNLKALYGDEPVPGHS
ncbi:MAG TPA: ATP-binding protein [Streptosporangiaceae bacterium]|nr:ATP-binding protein [Streptosporangiaceae bacterium]